MPRSMWSGAISFGLVNVPVKLYSAVSRKTVRFHQLNGKTGTRIAQKRVDASTGEEVPYEDLVKGYELMMETMIFADEVVPPDQIDDLPEAGELQASERELKMAQQLIESLSSDFEPDKYRDEYRDKVLELIERKASGEEIAVQPEAPQPAKVPDLMAALEASLAAVKGGDAEPAAKPAPKRSRKKEPAA